MSCGRNPESSRVPWGECDWTARDIAEEPVFLTDADPGDEHEERDTRCLHAQAGREARCNGGAYDGCACGPYPKRSDAC